MQEESCQISIITREESDSYYTTVHHNLNKKQIFYTEKDKTITTYDYENDILKRDNEQMCLEYQFRLNEKTINNIYIKELKDTLKIELLTKSIIKQDNILKIVYSIDNNDFVYQIKKEVK